MHMHAYARKCMHKHADMYEKLWLSKGFRDPSTPGKWDHTMGAGWAGVAATRDWHA